MKNSLKLSMILLFIVLNACTKKTDKDRAKELVETKYEDANKELDFENTKLDSLYNISPKAYADSIKKGKELDSVLALMESEIEHLPQKESDSVGLISAALTKHRYYLLELAKTKPTFLGWTLSGVTIQDEDSETLSFKFDKDITKILE